MSFSLDTYLEELRPLINVDCGTYTIEGIASIAKIMEKKYTDMGWTVKQVDCGIAGKGLEARNKPDAEHIDVLLIGHMDTVFPVGTVAERPMTQDAKRAYGPGVADMKAGLLTTVYALRAIDKAILDKLSICMCMNPDEEVGSLYSKEWLTSVAKKSKQVLVPEPGRANGDLVKARKGNGMYSIEFNGKAAHAGNDPQNGRSAITELAHWVLAINKLTNFESGLTFNIGVVKGGTVGNVVPDYAEATLDARFWDNDEYQKAHDSINAMTKTPFLDGVSITVTRKSHKPSMVPSKETKVLMALVEACAKEINLPIGWQEVGGGSDANLTSFLGVPSLDGFGPAGGGFHSLTEYIELSSIEPRIQLLQKVLMKIAS